MAQHLATALDIARQAGTLISQHFERRAGFELKGDYDLVTAADRASEDLIVDRLRTYFPTHGILGEESGQHLSASEYQWYVDPLDGTTNFAHGFPVFNVTLALEHAGQLVCGVIHDPTRQETFWAERGGGAWLNNRRISVSATTRLEESLLATGFPSRKRHQSVNVHFFHQISMITHGVRRAGAAAIDLAYVACGRLEGFWEFGLNPWDVAAGMLLIEEAGGTLSDMHGGPASLRGKHLAADNTHIHAELLGVFAEVFANRYRYPLPQISSAE